MKQSGFEKSEMGKSNGEGSYVFDAQPKSVEQFALQKTSRRLPSREHRSDFVASFASRSQNSCNFIRLVFSPLHPASPRIAHTSMLLLSWVRSCASRNLSNPLPRPGSVAF